MKVSEINNNPIAEAWKKRFSQLSEDKKLKIEELKNKKISEYQLKIIKKSKSYPEIGDIFKINPKENIYYSGIVLNNHINNKNGEDLLLIIILKNDEDLNIKITRKITNRDLLIPPCIVGKEYWTRGYFSNYNHLSKKINIEQYGFYGILDGLYYNEYDQKLNGIPEIISMGSVYTISGIAFDINKEIIINS